MSYPLVPISDFATLALRPIQLQPNQEYVGIGVKWYGGGVSEHERRLGAEFNAERFLVRAGDLIYNDMWARKGSVAIVPPSFDGAVGSFHFPTFEVDQARADLRYLALYTKVPRFWEDCDGISRGSTGRNQIRVSTFLSLRVPLPDLDEQQRIVARLDGVIERLDCVSALLADRDTDLERLQTRLITGSSGFTNPRVTISRVLQMDPECVDVVPGRPYRFAGIRSFGKGLFQAGTKVAGEDFKYSKLVPLRAGRLVYPKLMAWEGALAVVPPEFDGLYVSPEFVQFQIAGPVSPPVVDAWFRSQAALLDLRAGSTGTNVRRNRLMPSAFMQMSMPLPPPSAQRAVESVAALRSAIEGAGVRMDDVDRLRSVAIAQAFGALG